MRLFCALVLPDDLKDAIAETANAIRRGVRGAYVRPDSYHMTLAFIGEGDDDMAERAAGALERACAGTGTVALRPNALGKFGRRENATLWVGFEGGRAAASLAASLRAELEAADVPFDAKPFRAHVTIARHARLSRPSIPGPFFPHAFHARSAALFESELDPHGARYRIIEEVAL